jgi:hypothetical protein
MQNVNQNKETKMDELETFRKELEIAKALEENCVDVSTFHETAKEQKQLIEIRKNIVVSYVSDATGCGHIRTIFPMNYINAVYGKNQDIVPIVSPIFIWQEDFLYRAKTLHFQRQMTKDHLEVIRKYYELKSKYGYQMVYDIDDFLWGKNEEQGGDKEDGVPSYNFGMNSISPEIKKDTIEMMNLMDKVTVSSPYLKQYLEEVAGIKTPIIYIPNFVNMAFWGNSRRKPLKKKLEKPKVIYTGSPTHYSNEKKMYGDFEGAWYKFIVKQVNEDKIDFYCMGGLPWFFESIKDKIKIIDWVNSWQYHLPIMSIKPDIAIGPLVPNNFNYSKSYIKATEMYAAGVLFVGSVFSNGKPSPYDDNPVTANDKVSVEELETLFEAIKEPDLYNSIVSKQYEKLINEGMFMESPQAVEKIVNAYFN